ncbi:sulfotransferase [Streptomyces sp. NRRL S-87]|uniref:sulfotransferase family protein n=1 Tax=Streptomyces sp. NRRL S-87 TaxID=1463920 RepID=UPI0004C2635E|nr:sulfotransferase [Streptomyces sp. NRRL S-87]
MNKQTLINQLAAPDQDGSTIALYRTRAYRFSNDPRHYALAEAIEENFARGLPPTPQTMTYLRASLDQIRSTGDLLPFNPEVAQTEGIDIRYELDARRPYAPRPQPAHIPKTIVFIVGAPRSGTSHLYNCLAHTGRYAYFTTASCWAWPTRNLDHPDRQSFEDLDDRVLTVDNKNTRLIPGLLMPYESEDLYTRAIPTYHHLGGHTYDLTTAHTADADLLTTNIQAHCRHFDRDRFLTKSPFNSLRIPQLEALTDHTALYLHITRDRAGTADSMRRNRFSFHHNGTPLTEEEAAELFRRTVEQHAPADRLLTVRHSDLLAHQEATLRQVMAWAADRSGGGLDGAGGGPDKPS